MASPTRRKAGCRLRRGSVHDQIDGTILGGVRHSPSRRTPRARHNLLRAHLVACSHKTRLIRSLVAIVSIASLRVPGVRDVSPEQAVSTPRWGLCGVTTLSRVSSQ